MSSFKGQAIFSSGPHRFQIGQQGTYVLTSGALGSPGPNTYPSGSRELDIVVTGRLVAASRAALDTLRDAVTAQLLDPPTAGTLVDGGGRSWADMSFIFYEERTPVERGRAWSIAYTATFRRFNVAP